jgi:predicted DNA-binding transcriptional regulator YafY
MTKPASRLLTLILLLQAHPNQKAFDLASQLGVSVRTLHRYVEMLDEMGIPVYTERGPYGGFSLVRGYKMPPMIFSPEEAVAVCLGTSLVGDMWGQLYQEAALGALVKLENVLPDEQRDEVVWARRSLVAIGLHYPGLEVYAPVVAKLRQAIRELRRVEMVYQSASASEAAARLLDPYALALRLGWWYVVGFCHLRQEVRIFRLDRIRELNLLGEVFLVPENFDARKFLKGEFQGQPQIRSRVRFKPEAAQVARGNRSIWDRIEEQPDGSIIVTMSTPDLNWAASNILAYGPLVEVLDPPGLRQLVRDWAGAIVKQYGDQQTIGG